MKKSYKFTLPWAEIKAAYMKRCEEIALEKGFLNAEEYLKWVFKGITINIKKDKIE